MDSRDLALTFGDACASLALRQAGKERWRFLYIRPSRQIVGADLIEADLIASGFFPSASPQDADVVVVWEDDFQQLEDRGDRADLFVLSDQPGVEGRLHKRLDEISDRWCVFDQVDEASGMLDGQSAVNAVSDFALFLTDRD